jgi:hypothetical protein
MIDFSPKISLREICSSYKIPYTAMTGSNYTNIVLRAGGVTQVVQPLPSKHEFKLQFQKKKNKELLCSYLVNLNI